MVMRVLATRSSGSAAASLPFPFPPPSHMECMVQNMGRFHASGSPQSQHPLLPGEMLIRTIWPVWSVASKHRLHRQHVSSALHVLHAYEASPCLKMWPQALPRAASVYSAPSTAPWASRSLRVPFLA